MTTIAPPPPRGGGGRGHSSALETAAELIRHLDAALADVSSSAQGAASDAEDARRNARAASEVAKRYAARSYPHRGSSGPDATREESPIAPPPVSGDPTTSSAPPKEVGYRNARPPQSQPPSASTPAPQQRRDGRHLQNGGSDVARPPPPPPPILPQSSPPLPSQPSNNIATTQQHKNADAANDVHHPESTPDRGNSATLAASHAEDVLSLSLELERTRQSLRLERSSHADTRKDLTEARSKFEGSERERSRLVSVLETMQDDMKRNDEERRSELERAAARVRAAEEDADAALELAKNANDGREQAERWLSRALEEIEALKAKIQVLEERGRSDDAEGGAVVHMAAVAEEESAGGGGMGSEGGAVVPIGEASSRVVRFADNSSSGQAVAHPPPPPPPPVAGQHGGVMQQRSVVNHTHSTTTTTTTVTTTTERSESNHHTVLHAAGGEDASPTWTSSTTSQEQQREGSKGQQHAAAAIEGMPSVSATDTSPAATPSRAMVAAGRNLLRRASGPSSASSAAGDATTPTKGGGGDDDGHAYRISLLGRSAEKRRRLRECLSRGDGGPGSTPFPAARRRPPLASTPLPPTPTSSSRGVDLGFADRNGAACRNVVQTLRESGARLALGGRWWHRRLEAGATPTLSSSASSGKIAGGDDASDAEAATRDYCRCVEADIGRRKEEVRELEAFCEYLEKKIVAVAAATTMTTAMTTLSSTTTATSTAAVAEVDDSAQRL